MTTSTILHDFHSEIATSIANEIQFNRANYYYFLGKVEAWGSGDASPTVLLPDTYLADKQIRDNALFLKRIAPKNVSVATDRIDWATGTVFALWDHTLNMKGRNYYCVTDELVVFKCLDNAGGAQSTVKPTLKTYLPFRTADGYLWKYMYTIPNFKSNQFMSATKMPVQRALSDSFYNKGAIDSLTVASSGSGYTNYQLTTITVTGTTTGSGAVATITVGVTGNITGVVITNQGSGYTQGCAISFSSATGSGATGTAVINGTGNITNITINTPGLGYVAGESVVFSVGGAVLIPSVSRTTGSITKVNIVDPGIGYTAAPVLTVVGLGGTGKYGNTKAQLTAIVYNGKVVGVNIIDPGVTYPTDNSTNIIVKGDGSGAGFTPVLYNGSIVDVITESPGTGYTTVEIIVNGTGKGAILTPIITQSDFISDQSIIEQTTVVGAIYAVVIDVQGSGYTGTTVCNIIGDGTGATATPLVVNGAITKVIVNSFGTGYTYASVSFSDVNRTISGTNTDAVAHATLPPIAGHGKDAIKELYADTLALNVSLRQDQSFSTVLQDYRQFGILKNPENLNSGIMIRDDAVLMTYETEFTNVIGLLLDEVLLLNNIRYRVVAISGNIVQLQQLGSKNISPLGLMVAEANQTRTYTATSIKKYPIANKYSGSLLYVSNENPFTFTVDQGVTIKTFLRF